MAKSVNKVILVGNLGKDPEVKFTPSGVPVAKFSLATNERYKDKGGEWQDRTEWHNIVAWQRLAEIVGEYVKKGSKIYIEGRLQTSSWEDKQSGEKKYRTEVVASDLVLLGGRGEGGGETMKDVRREALRHLLTNAPRILRNTPRRQPRSPMRTFLFRKNSALREPGDKFLVKWLKNCLGAALAFRLANAQKDLCLLGPQPQFSRNLDHVSVLLSLNRFSSS